MANAALITSEHRHTPAGLRARLEAAVEAAIAALDALDGDPDLEAQCEDEGAQCEDEGEGRDEVCGHYGEDQSVPLSIFCYGITVA
jgi:hypothetical protein